MFNISFPPFAKIRVIRDPTSSSFFSFDRESHEFTRNADSAGSVALSSISYLFEKVRPQAAVLLFSINNLFFMYAFHPRRSAKSAVKMFGCLPTADRPTIALGVLWLKYDSSYPCILSPAKSSASSSAASKASSRRTSQS